MIEGERLTPREAEIESLLLLDFQEGEIADLFNITRKTVRNHTASIYRKRGVNKRRDLKTMKREPDLCDLVAFNGEQWEFSG